MAGKSFFKGVIGLFIFLVGLVLILSAFALSLISIFLGWFGIYFSFLAIVPFLNFIIGAALGWVGLKLFFENETETMKKFMGFVGIVLFILGWFFVMLGFVSGLVTWIATLLLWSIGIAFIGYGFKVKVLKVFRELVESVKGVVYK